MAQILQNHKKVANLNRFTFVITQLIICFLFAFLIFGLANYIKNPHHDLSSTIINSIIFGPIGIFIGISTTGFYYLKQKGIPQYFKLALGLSFLSFIFFLVISIMFFSGIPIIAYSIVVSGSVLGFNIAF